MALTPQQIAETQAAMDKHGLNYAAIARELGLARSTVRARVQQIKSLEGKTVETQGFHPSRASIPLDQFSMYEQIHGQRPPVRLRVKEWKQPQPEGPIYKVLAIGDPHDKPGRDKERFAWIGRHALKTMPDAIVCIGDMASLDSLSFHEKPGSTGDHGRPAFHQDLDSLDEALASFHRYLPKGLIPTYITLGNHEFRAWRSAEAQPKLCGDMPLRLEEVFTRWQWETRPFGQFLDLFGVDFVHVPMNVMGREMGGEHVERTVANKAMRSVVFGHTHKRNVHNAVKVGQDRKITALNLGTAMPWGVTEKYNKRSTTGWSYGIYELRIQDGNIISEKFYDMLELYEMYGE